MSLPYTVGHCRLIPTSNLSRLDDNIPPRLNAGFKNADVRYLPVPPSPLLSSTLDLRSLIYSFSMLASQTGQ